MSEKSKTWEEIASAEVPSETDQREEALGKLAQEEDVILEAKAKNKEEAAQIASEKEKLDSSDKSEIDEVVEKALTEMSDEEASEKKGEENYDEWKGMGKRYLTLDKILSSVSDKMMQLKKDLEILQVHGGMVDVDNIDDPTKMDGWDKLTQEEKDDKIEYAHIVSKQKELNSSQQQLQTEKDAAQDWLKSTHDLSDEDVRTELSIHGDDEITEDDISLARKKITREDSTNSKVA